MRALRAFLLLAIAGAAAAQAPAPASSTQSPPQPPEAPPKPRPALKLNLDEVEPARPRITFGAPEEKSDKKEKKEKKDDAAGNLPGLGGRPSNEWERPASSVFPPNGDVGPVTK
jgi:hypothetical protein